MTITHESVLTPVGVEPARYAIPDAATDACTLSLDGVWRFRLFPEAVTGVDPGDPGQDWDEIEVPGHWQLAGAPTRWPYGVPEYNNKLFPFPIEPPFVPDANPTGEYRLTLRVPADWPAAGRTVLRFDGVDSWFQVALDGEVVATSHGSRLPTEIDVTDRTRPGATVLLAVRVTKWSAFSYVEDQDQWWLSGIFRSVRLEHRPHGGIGHVRVDADYDHTTGLGTLTVAAELLDPAAVRVRVPELGIDIGLEDQARIAVEPWSAETPRLYELVVSAPGETVHLAVGFRNIAIEDGTFTVNGRPIKLRGVNRHEFEPTRGRAVTRESMLADVLLMKRHHLNAVRTSHYPPHPHFLDLCDSYGLYVIDENDLETHGFENGGWEGNPVDDPAWTEVLVDRVRRMVRRDAHHPSIIMWSLGNEAGGGLNIAAMAAEVRTLDPSRPLHYEGDWSSEDVDVYSRMYADVEHTELIGRRVEAPLERAALDAHRRRMPFVQCEYAHAMGNGPGGLSDYDAVVDRYPRLMGGFVWEWIDHGLLQSDDMGVPFHSYGGDFGERFHDGTFIADGLVLPDRTPSPSLREVAAVFAPVRIDAIGDGTLLVRNRYAFRDTSHARFLWRLHSAGVVLAEGELSLMLAPGEQAVVTPPADLPAPARPGAPVWWTLRAVQEEAAPLDSAWFPASTDPAAFPGAGPGFTLGAGELLLTERARPSRPTGQVSRTGDGGYAVGPARFDSFGRLRALGPRPVEVARVDAWRAPTDNDRRAGMWRGPSDSQVWRESGLHLMAERVIAAGLDGAALVVRSRAAGPRTRAGIGVTSRWQQVDEHTADLVVEMTPEHRWPSHTARLGLLLALTEPAAGTASISWTGLGPDESYADSRAAALAGSWQHTVADWQTRYTHPQENGARRGVTTAGLAFADGTSLRIDAYEVSVGGVPRTGMELSLRPWSDEALERAAHPHELVPDGRLWIHLDAAQHGLGSAACGPGVLPNAQLRPAQVRMQLRFTVD